MHLYVDSIARFRIQAFAKATGRNLSNAARGLVELGWKAHTRETERALLPAKVFQQLEARRGEGHAVVSTYLPNHVAARLKQIADHEGRSMSTVTAALVGDALQAQKKSPSAE